MQRFKNFTQTKLVPINNALDAMTTPSVDPVVVTVVAVPEHVPEVVIPVIQAVPEPVAAVVASAETA